MAINERISRNGREMLGPRISRLRQKAGLTQADLGKAVGVSPACISNWEADNTHPRAGNFQRLADALGTTRGSLESESESEGEPATKLNKASAVTLGEQALILRDLTRNAIDAIASAAGIAPKNVHITLDYSL